MDTQIFITMKELITLLLDLNQPILRLYIVLGVSALTGALAMSLIGSLLSEHRINFLIALALLLVGCFLVLLGATVAKMYICPHVPADYSLWVLIGVAVLTFLILVIPLISKVNGTNQLVTLATVVSAIVVAILMFYLSGLLYDVIVDGRKIFNSERSSKQARDRAIGL